MKNLGLSLLGLALTSCAVHFDAKVEAAEGRPGAVEASSDMKSSASGTVAAGAAAKKNGKAFPYDVQREVLPNGLKVLMVPMESDGLVSYWSIVRTGSRDEVEPGVTGFAHFFEHMMFRGTEKRPEAEYARVVGSIGADSNAFTNDDLTAYHLSFGAEDLATVIDIEADRFQYLKYDEQQFRTEAGAVYGEYRKGRTEPISVLYEAIQEKAFDVHTYKHTTIGFEADIKRMPEQYEYSKSFFQRFYRPENVVLLIVGDFDPAAALELVKKHYGGWEKGYQAPNVPQEPAQTGQRRIDVSFDGKTLPRLALAFKGERLLPRDRKMMAATLLGELAFGETSAIYKKLVLDEQRLESLGAGFGPQRDPGLWPVIARVKDPADVHAIEAELWATVDEYRGELVSQKRLDEVRSRLKYSFLSNLSTPNNVCESVAYEIATAGDISVVDEMYATLDQVTPDDVRAAAVQWLKRESCTVATLHAADEAIPAPVAASASPSAPARFAQPPVLMPVPNDPNVVFKLWFRVGSQDDPPGKEGLAQLTGRLAGESGTKKLTYDQLLQRLYPLAGSIGASVDKEMTVFGGSVHRDKAAEFYALFAEALTQPGFRAEDFQRLRDETISYVENTLRYASEEELGKAALYEMVFAGTPYEHVDSGTVASLKAITLDDVVAFWREHYTRDNVVVGLGGAYGADLADRLARDLVTLAAGAPEPTPPSAARPIRGRQVLIVEKQGKSTAISFGLPIDVHRGSREYYALWIANSWLGEHRNTQSHLFGVIRGKRGLNYGDYSYIEAFPNGGRRSMPPTGVGRRSQMFEVWIRPVVDTNAPFALRAALREVEALVEKGMTREQFEFTRKFLKNYALHFAETTEDRLGYAIDDRFYGLEASHLAAFRKAMDEVTYEEVNAALKKHLKLGNLAIALVTADAAAMKQRLTSGEPTPVDYEGKEMPAEIVAEDAVIASYPLAIRAEDVRILPVAEFAQSAGRTPGP